MTGVATHGELPGEYQGNSVFPVEHGGSDDHLRSRIISAGAELNAENWTASLRTTGKRIAMKIILCCSNLQKFGPCRPQIRHSLLSKDETKKYSTLIVVSLELV